MGEHLTRRHMARTLACRGCLAVWHDQAPVFSPLLIAFVEPSSAIEGFVSVCKRVLLPFRISTCLICLIVHCLWEGGVFMQFLLPMGLLF